MKKSRIHYEIILTESEARLLHSLVQNPLSEDPNPANEDPAVSALRLKLFNETMP